MADASDVRLAYDLAEAAGDLLISVRRSGLFAARELGAVGDRLASTFLMRALAQHRPDDAVLCEEEKDGAGRLSANRVWIVDPIDGTREYGEGQNDWAVHVGLAIRGEAIVGAVALPAAGITLTSNDKVARPIPPANPRIVVSRTRPAQEALIVAEAMSAELVPMGSAGAKAMAVVRGEAEIYLHSGGQYEWDSCAPVAVARDAGLHVSRIDGSPVEYNQPDPYLPDLLICVPKYAEAVLEACASPPVLEARS